MLIILDTLNSSMMMVMMMICKYSTREQFSWLLHCQHRSWTATFNIHPRLTTARNYALPLQAL